MRTPPSLAPFTSELEGLRVSRPWKGYGSAIFLELGELRETEGVLGASIQGEASISIEWDWRLELQSQIVCGSSTSGATMLSGLRKLADSSVLRINVVGEVPELIVHFSNGHILRSMVMAPGDPQWTLKSKQGTWLYVRDGALVTGDGTQQTTQEEEQAFEIAESAASRWGVPVAGGRAGACKDCVFYVPLDGNGHLLDYGCCASSASPFDGRAVYYTSGCAFFSRTSEA